MKSTMGRTAGREKRADQEFFEKILSINRVTKVTKGGKNLSFSVLVVVGDGKGRVGFFLAKAREIADSIRKSIAGAKKNMFSVPVEDGRTIPHEIIGHFGAAKVLLKPASEGTGVIASGPVRAMCEAAGLKDILTKCLKSNNPINVVRATAEGFKNLKTDPEPEPEPTEENATA